MENGERLRVATYNVRGCRGMDGQRSEQRIAEVIAALDVDVIGLQELDVNRARSAGVDQAAVIAEHLGWHRYFHPAMVMAEEHYGDAILSRYPMRLRQAKVLPSVTTRLCPESRAALWAEIETSRGTLHVINTHLGLGRRERLMQAELLAGPEWLESRDENQPLVLMGDFNTFPGSAVFRVLTRELRDVRKLVSPSPRLRTFPTRYPLFAVDHIFVSDLLEVDSISVIRNRQTRIASDHFPLVAHLRPAKS
ncbi:MAG TPA: endonuclease/exonuclease/phosphatase family protein [Chthoniobacterales bacterium]|jgi:endonuclease/exonuclease/phosphatase family metal-dependent hydrolase|nr:endonuclease/exonuclease/phosphatase family protein [Chthoniobacterales bacterium]